jgi:hypothetical protein
MSTTVAIAIAVIAERVPEPVLTRTIIARESVVAASPTRCVVAATGGAVPSVASAVTTVTTVIASTIFTSALLAAALSPAVVECGA